MGHIPYGTLAQTCAVRTTIAWIEAPIEHDLTMGPLLRGADRHRCRSGTPWVTLRRTGLMSGAGISLFVQGLATTSGLEAVTAHSLRAGSATASAMAGVPRPGRVAGAVEADLHRGGRLHPHRRQLEEQPPAESNEEGERGLVRVNLTGTQLTEYLDHLDHDAHASAFYSISAEDQAAAARVYTAISDVVDQISPRSDEDDPAPEVIIDDTITEEA